MILFIFISPLMKLQKKEFTTFPPIICRKLFFHSAQLFFPYIDVVGKRYFDPFDTRLLRALHSRNLLNSPKLLSYKILPRSQASSFIFPPLFCRSLHILSKENGNVNTAFPFSFKAIFLSLYIFLQEYRLRW